MPELHRAPAGPLRYKRPFTLLDWLIVVAGVGFGLAQHRAGDDWLHLAVRSARGLAAVGPLIVARGWRLTGRSPAYFGEWLWLLLGPLAILAGAVTWAQPLAWWAESRVVASVALAEGAAVVVLVSWALTKRRRTAPRVLVCATERAAPPLHGLRMQVWPVVVMLLWLAPAPFALGALLAGTNTADAIWTLVLCVGMLGVLVAVAVYFDQRGQADHGRRRPLTHHIGMTLATFMALEGGFGAIGLFALMPLVF